MPRDVNRPAMLWQLLSDNALHLFTDRSADFQSAVSPNCIRQSAGSVPRAEVPRRRAEMTFAPRLRCQNRGRGARLCDPSRVVSCLVRVPGVSLPPQPPANIWQASGLRSRQVARELHSLQIRQESAPWHCRDRVPDVCGRGVRACASPGPGNEGLLREYRSRNGGPRRRGNPIRP